MKHSHTVCVNEKLSLPKRHCCHPYTCSTQPPTATTMGKKSKAQKLKEATAETAPVGASPQFEPPEEPFFPFARYTSIVGVHTSLLLFTAFFLPRSSNQLGFTVTERPMSSRDRPQHEFLEALTANPLLTVASICLGTLVLQAWWAGWVRNWLFDWNHQALSDEERVEKTRVDASKLKVCPVILPCPLLTPLDTDTLPGVVCHCHCLRSLTWYSCTIWGAHPEVYVSCQ